MKLQYKPFEYGPVARLDQQPHIRVHERNLHSDVRAIGQDSSAVGASSLDEAEDVVPSVMRFN